MCDFKTPVRKRPGNIHGIAGPVTIPPSPFLKKLGYGTGVAVYKLERSPIANKIRSPWAIKKLIRTHTANLQCHKRLKEEAEILRKLDHPNIVGFRAFVKNANDQDCLAMEECSDSLGNMIEQRNELGLSAYPAQNIMKVARDISEALNYLHTEALLLHGDVKSYNVLIKGNFLICKLCDFGVTLPVKPNGELNHKKAGHNSEYIGTQLWSPPEAFKDPQVITTKADMFAYGLVLWEMLALCPPCLDSLDESDVSTGSFENGEPGSGCGKRPELPMQDFGDSYKYVLEIFHCCTEESPEARPSALDLTISIPEMIKALGFDVN